MSVIEGKNTWIRVLKCVLYSIIAFVFGPFLLIPGFRRLRKMPKEDKNRIILKAALITGSILYGLAALYVVCYIVFSMFFSDRRPGFGEHEQQVAWLMPEAADVSYFLSFSFSAYEFRIPEEVFRKALSKRPLKEITEPVKIRRYNYQYNLPESERTVLVKKGLTASESGLRGHYTVVYDRETGRAYFEESPNNKAEDAQKSM